MSDLLFKAVCVEGTLQHNPAFMPDSAAPHAIHKSNSIDQSSNSGLFEQTEKKKKEEQIQTLLYRNSFPLLFILTAILSNG